MTYIKAFEQFEANTIHRKSVFSKENNFYYCNKQSYTQEYMENAQHNMAET